MTKTLEQIVHDFLESLELGEAQVHENITIFPLMSPMEGSTDYLSLGKAVGEELLRVTEVSEEGSVPDLKVVNRSNRPILLVSGEELMGAKQNRVINTSILFKENCEEEVPVSCSEQGRWAHVSHEFALSKEMAGKTMRQTLSKSVRNSLRAGKRARSDQGQVWDDIEALQCIASVDSPTHAMSDVYKDQAKQLKKRLESFQKVPGQRGLVVLVDGKVVGLDFVSRSDAYQELHDKMVKSYVLEASLAEEKRETNPEDARLVAEHFLHEAVRCKGESHETIGHGKDHRLTGEKVTGSALVHENEVIHCTLLQIEEEENNMRARFWRRFPCSEE